MTAKYLRMSLISAALIATTVPPALAQTQPPRQETRAQDDRSDDRGLWGLLGLLGLAGLAGLMRRRDQYDGRTDATTRR